MSNSPLIMLYDQERKTPRIFFAEKYSWFNPRKITVLRNKLKLREESNPSYVKKIFITPDYTLLEQKRTRPLENNSQK